MKWGKFFVKPTNLFFNKFFEVSLSSIKEFFFYDLYESLPYIRKPIEFGRNILQSFKLIRVIKGLDVKYRLKYSNYKLKFKNTIYINPQKIQSWLEGRFSKNHNYKRLIERSWEKRNIPFEDSIIYRAFEWRFKQGKKWEETEFYNQVLNKISSGVIKWGCNNKKEWDEWLESIDLLYLNIKDNCETTQDELDPYYSNQIRIIINNVGNILIIDGIHIISIARLLNISKVPISVLARHKKWINFKKRIIYIIKRMTYQILPHPDLQDIPHLYGDFRYNLIKENLSVSQGKLLDIGSNLGYFCHMFEDSKFDCFAVEYNPTTLYFLKKIKIAENKEFKIIPKSIFEYNINQELVFDVVLALNVFHHFIKKKDTFLNLIKLLKRLKVKELFLGVHNPREFQNKKIYRNFTTDEFVNFIIENSCLNSAKFLGRTKNGRPLYKLYS